MALSGRLPSPRCCECRLALAKRTLPGEARVNAPTRPGPHAAELLALRGTIEALSFVYTVPGYRGEDRVYIIRRGSIRRWRRWRWQGRSSTDGS